jgi:hypothetical protein
MTIDDQMIKLIMADRNAAMAATALSPHSEEGKVVECEISDKDFVWPSR